MSDVPTTSSTISLSTHLAPEISEAFNRETTVAKILPVKMASNPAGPTWAVNKGGSLVRNHAEGSAVTDFGSDVQGTVSLGWGLKESPFHVTDESMARAAVTVTPNANVNLWVQEVSTHAAALSKEIETDLFSGSGSNSIIGFDEAIADDNTYAGVDRSSGANAYWRSYVAAPGSLTALSKDQIRGDLAQIKINSGKKPNLAFCNPLVFNQVVKLFDANIMYFFGGSSGPSSSFLGEAATPYVNIFGMKFVETSGDGYAESGNGAIYYVNSDFVHIEALPYPSVPGFVNMGVSGDTNLSSYFDVVRLAKDGNRSKANIRVQAQLVVRNPITCGKRVDISI